jgi:hypothetical protein
VRLRFASFHCRQVMSHADNDCQFSRCGKDPTNFPSDSAFYADSIRRLLVNSVVRTCSEKFDVSLLRILPSQPRGSADQ